jgi:hypothetical protein
MIDPSAIPEFTGHLGQLERDARALARNALAIRATGQSVHHEFQGLSAYYHAPEAEQLLAATVPVRSRADEFATKLETVSGALDEYAGEVRPIVQQLARLRADATRFVADCGDGDDWQYDGDKVRHNNDLMHDVGAAVAAFWDAERRAANTITGLVGGTRWVRDDGSHRKGMYGCAADAVEHAQSTPWGAPESEEHHWYEVGHWVKSFAWDGFVVDGVWGTVRGLGTLTGFGGWKAFKSSWHHLGDLGIGLSTGPAGTALLLATPDRLLPGPLRSGKHAVVDTAKSLVAWDEWRKNPPRAAGAVTFNALTTLVTDDAGSAANSGPAAKASTAAGRAGRTADPMTYIPKTGGLPLKRLRLDPPNSADVTAKLPTSDLPANSTHLPNDHALHPDGTLTGPDGNVVDHPLPKEPPTTDVPTPPEPELAHAGAAGHGAHHTTSSTQAENAPGPKVGHRLSAGENNAGDSGTTGLPPAHRSHSPASGTGHGVGVSGHEHTSGGHGGEGGSGEHGGHGEQGSGGADPNSPHNPIGDPHSGGHDPLERGGETEQGIREAMRGSKVKRDDLERVLENLANHPAGREIAESVASGRHAGQENFDQVVSSLSHPDKMAGGIEQIRLADRLKRNGVEDISFEVKEGLVHGQQCDMDVLARNHHGTTYAYQFKALRDPVDPFKAITKGKNIGQLLKSDADNQIMFVDGQGTLADWTAKGIPDLLMSKYRSSGVEFIIRLDDGSLRIPPHGEFFPRSS